MGSVNEYRRYADECLALAQALSDPADRARLLQIAKAWREMADKNDWSKDGGKN
jgi:uncharacterized protein YjiS (DUF1127 family)